MIKRNSYFSYVVLGVFLLGVLSLPIKYSNKIRSLFIKSLPVSSVAIQKNELEQLQVENQRLKEQIQGVLDWLLFDQRFEKQVEILKSLMEKKEHTSDFQLKEFFQRRSEDLSHLLKMQLRSLPAKVILREPTSWSSSLWIDVGFSKNEKLGHLIVAKNSPVIKGNSLIGVIETVLEDRSRVRLITDSGLIPSVRAVRGDRQHLEIAGQIDLLIDRLYSEDSFFLNGDEKMHFLTALEQMKKRLFSSKADLYLAKGELRGAASSYFRSYSSLLKGVGFNYAFSDEEGSCRDIRSDHKEPLIKVGDLLVTTGLDGIFPSGLDVAVVKEVCPLQEGDCYYEIEAKPSVGDLDHLETLFVLPPLSVSENL